MLKEIMQLKLTILNKYLLLCLISDICLYYNILVSC